MSISIASVQSISRFKKEGFLKKLTEDAFRDEVVRPLFYRMGYSDGRDLCGQSEKGKDAVFTEQNALGKTEIVTVQTKKGNLNLSSKASENVIQAITQLKTALQTSIPKIDSRSKCFPNKVILCASGKINDSARNHIVEEVKDPRIDFLDVDELIPYIDNNYPELWLGIDADIFPYFKAIKELVEGEKETLKDKTVFRGDVLMGAANDQNFISLNLYKTTVKIKKIRGQVTKVPDFYEMPVESVLNAPQRKILILGEAGSGKSTALLRMAYELVQKWIESREEKYQIPIMLRAVDLIDERSLIEHCDAATRKLTLSNKSSFTTNDLQEGRVKVLIDALDEIADQKDRDAVLQRIEDFSANYPLVQIILTSRPYAFMQEAQIASSYETYNISPIRWKQAEKILINLQKSKKISIPNVNEVLRRIEQVHGIELNPLLITVFAASAEYSRQDIPANITELFKKFTELMLGRWDENKGLGQQYQAPLKDFLLTKIAFRMHQRKQTKIKKADFLQLLKQELELRGHHGHIQQIFEELMCRSGLFRDLGDEMEFRHHLIQEFFAGRGITSITFIKENIMDEWWKHAIVFYFGERSSEIDQLHEILVEHFDSKAILTVATTIGMSIQACYLSEVSKKIDAWKWVINQLSTLKDGVLPDQLNKFPIINFLAFYLFGRDAVALSNIKEYGLQIENWIEEVSLGDKRGNLKRSVKKQEAV